jgi:hypothetical protein
MVWAFHMKANQKKPHKICQECLIDARLRGEKRISKQPTLPCDVHDPPELWPDNATAWQLWQMAQYQVLLFHSDNPKKPIIEPNYAALLPLIALYVEDRYDQQDTLEKVLLCHHIAQSHGVFDFLKSA